MTRNNKRDRKIQGFTTSDAVHGLNQIEIAEKKKQSEVLHDAVISYIRSHPSVQISVKRQINIQILSEKMHVLREISSNLNEFSAFESNFVAFCVDLCQLKHVDNKKLPLIVDMKELLIGVKDHHEPEYHKYMKVARKLLNKQTFALVFPIECPVLDIAPNKDDIRKKAVKKALKLGSESRL